MTTKQKPVMGPRKYRELSDKELNEIMRAVGDRVRAQSIDLKKRMKISLQQEFDSARTAFIDHDKKKP